MQPPSNVNIVLPAGGQPLFAAGAGQCVKRDTGEIAIAAVLTCRLHPDVSHSPSPPLLMFAFVVFDKGEQFLIADALVHAVKPLSLVPYFSCSDLPQPLYFPELLF